MLINKSHRNLNCSFFYINRLIRYQIDHPPGYGCNDEFYRNIRHKHLQHNRGADNAGKGYERENYAVDWRGNHIRNHNPQPLRFILAKARGPPLIGLGISKLRDNLGYDAADHNANLDSK